MVIGIALTFAIGAGVVYCLKHFSEWIVQDDPVAITKETMQAYANKLERFRKQCRQYPEEEMQPQKLIKRQMLGTRCLFEARTFKGGVFDYWKNKIEYKRLDKSFILTSFGSDREPGKTGGDESADIVYDSQKKGF
jgi:hypothetical protein